jgi:DNA polymerase-3 subunit beta
METGDASVRLAATDLKVSIECLVDCAVEEPGSLTVSSQRLASILSELPDRDILIELGENNVINLECGDHPDQAVQHVAGGISADPRLRGGGAAGTPGRAPEKLFAKTSFAICADQSRYNLTGLLSNCPTASSRSWRRTAGA